MKDTNLGKFTLISSEDYLMTIYYTFTITNYYNL